MRRFTFPTLPRSCRHVADIACQVVRLRDFRLVADRISDLSLDGLLATPAEPILTGEELLVSFRLPHWGRWVDLEGTVARVAHARRPGERARGLGVQLASIDDRSRRLLELTLKWLPPAPQRYRPGRRGTQAALSRLIQASSLVVPPPASGFARVHPLAPPMTFVPAA